MTQNLDKTLASIYRVHSKPRPGPITIEWDEHDRFTARDGTGAAFMMGSRRMYEAARKMLISPQPDNHAL